MTPLDPLAAELQGVRLIEASAGTGKTHTIATLFVRLVLERRLSVDQILVVTFTNAATAELRDRIRKRLRDALAAFEGLPVPDPSLRALAERSRTLAGDRKRLAAALAAVDKAGVMTIHGFCQRMLAEHAFDGGVRSELALLPDIQPIVDDIVHDFWNVRFERATRSQIEYARSHGLGGRDLVKLAMLAARLPDAPIVVRPAPEGAGLAAALSTYFDARKRASAEWLGARDATVELLRRSEALNRSKYSEKVCERIVQSMDALAVARDDSFGGWVDDVEKLSQRYLVNGIKKGKIVPKHPLFVICDDLVAARNQAEEELAGWAQSVELELALHVRAELPKRTRARAAQSFDDVIYALRNALRGPRARAFAAAVRRRFPAALIDEFHDTDPVQYEIFRKIYRARTTSLFLIGDPKQAIYAFRGADVFAYIGAAEDADSRATLGTNHRSDPTLVHAVNTVFSRVPAPFLLEEIRFEKVGTPSSAEDRLRRNGEPASGIEIVVVPRPAPAEGQKRVPLSHEAVAPLAAAEIARTLGASTTLKERGGAIRPLEPGDFAVLTRTNAEAVAVQRALRARDVPSVLHGDASVLDTDEARETGLVLQALADPGSATAIRSALSTGVFGLGASELFALGDDEGAWETWANRFATWHATWERRGFLAAMRQLFHELGTTARLLGTTGGERKLTNLLHLTELCHQQATDAHLGVAGLLAWFGEVRHDDEAREGMAAEAQQIRLESDARAVQLTTMHRSKGLEYPVVVLPYLWRSAEMFKSERARLRYHDPDRNNELVIDLRAEEDKEDALAHATRETLAEGLRLAYVALTRARHRTILLWGPFQGLHLSALGRLLHPSILRGDDMSALSDDVIWRDLEALAIDAGRGVVVRHATETDSRYRAPARPTAHLAARKITRTLSSMFRTSSFSALSAGASAAHAHVEDELDTDEAMPSAEPAAPLADAEKVPLDEFPKGPRAGDALHAIFEYANFEQHDGPALSVLVRDQLIRHGFDAEAWTDRVTRGVSDMLRTSLSPNDATLTLSNVSNAHRLSELEFVFPVGEARGKSSLTAELLGKVFAEREGKGVPAGYGARVAALGFAPLSGFLRGFIDLVFEHAGRFYLVDYKSNHLGSAPADYAPSALVAPMTEHHYYLQYHLYLVALHRYLKPRVPEYDYARHVGGVAYLFLRGMAPERGASTGIFFDVPPEAVVERLSSILSAGKPTDRRRAH